MLAKTGPRLWTPGDWNAFFGFGTNILVNMLVLLISCVTAAGIAYNRGYDDGLHDRAVIHSNEDQP